jgi:hypothetical protein
MGLAPCWQAKGIAHSVHLFVGAALAAAYQVVSAHYFKRGDP